MREAVIDPEQCDGCQDCLDECVYEAIDMVRFNGSKRLKAQVNPERCCGCHSCEGVCELHGIRMEWVGYPDQARAFP
jgi:heterodisulfide reductase subunit A-like polyferredoxin